MTTHYKIKNQVQIYHVDSGLTVGAEFDHPLDAKAFLATIPPECDIADIVDNAELKEVLKNHRTTYPKPKRIEFYTKPMPSPFSRSTLPEAFYYGVLDEITAQYGIVQLQHRTSSSWEKEAGYHKLWLCVHIPTRYTIGIGSAPLMKDQVKTFEEMRYVYKGDGLFVSDENPRFKTRSANQVTYLTE